MVQCDGMVRHLCCIKESVVL